MGFVVAINYINADVLDGLGRLLDESVQSVVTSPPYWGMRDYGVDGQIGLEPDLDSHINHLVLVFRAVRRILREDGVLWLNYGDCYACTPNGRKAVDIVNDDRGFVDKPFSTVHGCFKAKDLIPASWRLAIALQEDGWWLRSANIWAKTNPMPESAKDRPTVAHEYVFMLTKASKYQYFHEAVRQPSTGRAYSFRRENSKRGVAQVGQYNGTHRPDRKDGYVGDGKRGLRSVWEFKTEPFKEAHFATFPPKLVETCLLASTKEGDHVLDPFGGAGTTGLVAERLRRNCTLIELNQDYLEIAKKRIADDCLPLLEAR